MGEFDGQRVVVTGGTRGIGAAISRAFWAEGAIVHATFAGNTARAEAMAAELSEGGRFFTHGFDVGEAEAVEAFFASLPEAPQVVVANAGIRRDQIVGAMPAEDWRRVLQVNLDGGFYVAKEAVKLMSRKRYGRIVFITSPSGKLGFAGQSNYAAAKAGQVALARSLSKEVGKRKITVNCVSPGFIDTELLEDLSEEHKKGFLDMVPLKRFGTPEEVASAVLYLSSKAAGYISGATLEVTGGL